MSEVAQCLWPTERLTEAVDALSLAAGLPRRAVSPPRVPAGLTGIELSRWLRRTAAWMGVEAEEVEARYGELDEVIRHIGTGVLGNPEQGWLAVLDGGGRVRVLAPDLGLRRLHAAEVRALLGARLTAAATGDAERTLRRAGVHGPAAPRALEALLRAQLGSRRLRIGWLVRPPASTALGILARDAGVWRLGALLLACHATQYGMFLLSWYLVGRGALSGRLDGGLLIGWALLLLTLVPLRMLTTWAQGLISIETGALLKWRLLLGALRLEPDEVRTQGAGGLLARVHESEAIESMALSAGMLGVVGLLELAIAFVVLGLGAGGWVQVAALAAWTGLTLALARRYHHYRASWTSHRLALTNELVERMAGHRTRLAQQRPSRWHDGEDAGVALYTSLSASLDRAGARLRALVPNGWLLLGVLTLVPALVAETTTASVAIAVGGVLLALRALDQLVAGLAAVSGAVVAWRQVGPLYRAAVPGRPAATPPRAPGGLETGPLMEAYDIGFAYPARHRPVLEGCNLVIRDGDRLLLEGVSGGGKTTLASLLVGLRVPDSGLLLLRGLDRDTLGDEGWRQHAVAAPQFHENHVLTETFAFNLLLGREWPPEPEDVTEALAVCEELGLGELLAQMPGGLLQMVGETGWQLSHGEQSRLFLARALLQRAELVVLDETFAALDPENLRRALACARRRAKTLLVIAHP